MNRKDIPKGWRLLRYGEKLTYPFKLAGEYAGNVIFENGNSRNPSIGRYRNRTWAKVIVPKTSININNNSTNEFLYEYITQFN